MADNGYDCSLSAIFSYINIVLDLLIGSLFCGMKSNRLLHDISKTDCYCFLNRYSTPLTFSMYLGWVGSDSIFVFR